MPAFRDFEIEAIRLMASGALSDEQLMAVFNADHPDRYNYTGGGYFLTVGHSSLPAQRRTLPDPPVVGRVGEIQAGFVVFLANHELTLECHTWGPIDVPEDFRDQEVIVSTPPANYVGIRNAT